jgi:glucose-1-phosphate cytidylyltransferase
MLNKIKTVILCGGKGTRLGLITKLKPKPMIDINGEPMVWRIIKLYNKFQVQNFILAIGYKSKYIKDYFKQLNGKKKNNIKVLINSKKKLLTKNEINIQLVDTGLNTLTGGRLLRLRKYFKKNEDFFLTYGDGLANINIKKIYNLYKRKKKIALVSAVKPPSRFGALRFTNNFISSFKEKVQIETGWINGGFFVFNEKIFEFIKNDNSILEQETMKQLVNRKQLIGYKHQGFWQCVDTIRDKEILEENLKKYE